MTWTGKKRLKEWGEELVQFAKIQAVSVSTPSEPYLQRYPFMKPAFGNDLDHWDWIGTGAGVSCGIQALAEGIGRSEISMKEFEKAVMELSRTFEKAHGQGSFEVVADCRRFIARTIGLDNSSVEESLRATGTWAVWNVLGRSPEEGPETEASMALGFLLGAPFAIRQPDTKLSWQALD